MSSIFHRSSPLAKPARALALLLFCGAAAAFAQSRPNILFIMTDQQRWDCVGANGNTIIKTPNLDRLAARGANFSHAFVASPVCVPSRISFFTGRYAHSHRNRVNYTPLDPSEVLIQGRLKEAGYHTASIGKLHYYPPSAEQARRTGFDIVELHDGNTSTDLWSDYVKWRLAHDPKKDVYYRALAKDIAPGKNPFRAAIDAQYTDTAWAGERARYWLGELAKDGKPFFLNVSFWKPHSPYETAVPYDSMYDNVDIPLPQQFTDDDLKKLPAPLQKLVMRGDNGGRAKHDRERLEWIYRSYYGAISHVDHEIGLLLDALEATGQANNTIIVFSSDHGDQLMEHGILGKNCFFEPAVRVPFMFSLPGRIPQSRHDEMIETVDFLPTLFELIGLPEPRECQGRSFAPLLTGTGAYTPHDAVFSENVIPEVITGGNLDLPFEKGKGVDGIRHPDAKMVRTDRWKYCYYADGDRELYDIKADPGEHNNLAGHPELHAVEEELQTRILNWLIDSSETDEIAPRWLVK